MVKSVRIRSFPSPYFTAFGLNTERYGVHSVQMLENMEQKNSEYEHFSRSVTLLQTMKTSYNNEY